MFSFNIDDIMTFYYDILLRYMFPVAEKKEDDSWQRNPGGVWMASQDKVGTGERLCFIRSS